VDAVDLASKPYTAVDRARADVAIGELARARDRLASYLASPTDVDPQVQVELGRICLQMGDPEAAGRYWLTADASGPEVEAAVDRYVSAHTNIAHALKRLPWWTLPEGEVPPVVVARLQRLQAPKLTPRPPAPPSVQGVPANAPAKGVVAEVVDYTWPFVATVVAVAVLIGLYEAIRFFVLRAL